MGNWLMRRDGGCERVDRATALDRDVVIALLGPRMAEASFGRVWIWRDRSGAPMGVAGLTNWWSGGERPGPNLWVEVHRDVRRRGVARRLCFEAESWAMELGASSIYGSHAIERGPSLDAAAALGFTGFAAATEWDLDVASVDAECDRLVARSDLRGRDPSSGYRAIAAADWTDEQRESIAAAHAEVLGGLAADIRRRLDPAHAQAFSTLVSTAVFDRDGGLAAAALVTTGRRGGAVHAMVEGLFTLPAFRQSVVTPLLQREVARAYRGIGGRIFTMATMDHHRGTRRQAERLGPVASREMFRPFKVLPGALG